MKFSAVFCNALFASSISAAALKKKHSHRHTHPLIRVPGPRTLENDTNRTNTDFSTNWAGAVLTSPPAGEFFNAVSGTFTVPVPTVPNGASPGSYSGCAWVGIDGDTYGGAILQSGIDWTVDSNNGLSYSAWIEWFPVAQVTIEGFNINAGDVISVSITSQSPSTGTVVFTDETTGQSVTQTASAPTASNTLEGVNAEWIVEDFSINTGLVPFADYGTMSLTNCAAGTPAGTVDATGADILEMVDNNNNVISSVSQTSGSEIDVTYV